MLTIPEIVGLDSRSGFIRIPPEQDVPLTDRVRRIIDTEAFRRLAKITQVGLVSLVYPAARHTRFEHSLGVYYLALLFLKRLAHDSRFTSTVSRKEAELLIVSALLHDIGHWPFCHLIEDIRIDGLPHHETFASKFLLNGEIADLLQSDWDIEPQDIVDLLNGNIDPRHSSRRLLSSILSGPIDIDKMDYLFRDSLHAGVPYGHNLDQNRLIGSLCLNESGNGLAITEKGKTAAELMVFARYVMFSEVYWQHAVRSATSMLQRLFREQHAQGRIDLERFFTMSEDEAIRCLRSISKGTNTENLAEGLFGSRRILYKRVAQFNIMDQPEIYRRIAGKPYQTNCDLAEKLSKTLSDEKPPLALLIDAPPVEKEVEIKIDVYYPKENHYRTLEDVSPVVRAMAKEQFDDYAKRVRVFAHPGLAVSFSNNERKLQDLIESLFN